MRWSASGWKILSISGANLLIYRFLSTTVFNQPDSHLRAQSLNPETFDKAIPRKVWQTWHTSGGLAEEAGDRVRTWQEINPMHRWELLTESSGESYVREHYANDDLVRDVFFNLTDPVLRADLLSYLVLYADGGVYADVDVSCLEPIDTWSSPELLAQASAIVGIEKDREPVEKDYRLNSDYRSYIFGINNWTFASKPRHPFLRLVIDTVCKNLLALAKQQNRPLSQIEPSHKEVIEATGPRAFTDAFWAYVSQVKGGRVTYKSATMMEEPKMFGDVLLLPIRAMSFSEAEEGRGAKSLKVKPVIMHSSVGTGIPTPPAVLGQIPEGGEAQQPLA